MLAALSEIIRCALLRVSPAYHGRVIRRYWSGSASTHLESSASGYQFYASQISERLGDWTTAGRILDHGAGRGEIGRLLLDQGYVVEFSEVSTTFVSEMRSAGLVCYAADDIPAKRYWTVFANNSIFYVHPRHLYGEIRRLLALLQSGGRLMLLDVPVRERSHMLLASRSRRMLWRLTGVYQSRAGGFFVDQNALCEAFPGTRVTDSWCSYRVHFEIAG